LDGLFSGVLRPGLPYGAEIQFYLEITDLSGQTIVTPSEPVFSSPGQPVALHTVGVNPSLLPIEISEVVVSNENGLRDELGLTPDWVEIRNRSSQPVSLRGVSLGTGFFGWNSRFNFSETEPALNPGEHRVIYCDGRAASGPPHAPFQLAKTGDQLTLTSTSPNGARLLVDAIAFGPQPTDVALARTGPGGAWRQTVPTPERQNVIGWEGVLSGDAQKFSLIFPTTTNGTYVVEFSDALPGAWTGLPAISGDGVEHVIEQWTVPQRYYRVRRDP